MHSYKTVAAFLLLFALLMSQQSCKACSLALHDWRLCFFAKIELPSPVLPFAELDIPIRRMLHGTSRILWIIDRQWYNVVQVAMFSFFYKMLANLPDSADLFKPEGIEALPSFLKPVSWPLRTAWDIVPQGDSVGEITFQSAKNKDFPLIVGSDKNSFKIALFWDANSSGYCFQLVLLQEGRIRAVHASPQSPWAQEISPKAYLSLIFFQLPLPGKILNLSIYPVNSSRLSIIEDEVLATELLEKELLLPRPAADFDPASNNIPELPE